MLNDLNELETDKQKLGEDNFFVTLKTSKFKLTNYFPRLDKFVLSTEQDTFEQTFNKLLKNPPLPSLYLI